MEGKESGRKVRAGPTELQLDLRTLLFMWWYAT